MDQIIVWVSDMVNQMQEERRQANRDLEITPEEIVGQLKSGTGKMEGRWGTVSLSYLRDVVCGKKTALTPKQRIFLLATFGLDWTNPAIGPETDWLQVCALLLRDCPPPPPQTHV